MDGNHVGLLGSIGNLDEHQKDLLEAMTRQSFLLRVGAWVLMIAIIGAVVFGASAFAQRRAPHPDVATVFVSPHPDDEFQMWSLVEGRPNEYKIFATMTMGEGTGYCEPETYEDALQEELGELPANPTPEGKRSEACEKARVASLLGFFTQMAEVDPAVPGDFGEARTFLLPAAEDVECAEGQDATECGIRSRRVQVWEDQRARGAVVVFDLGDGGLTVDTVEHALEALLTSREEWGLAPELPVGAMVAAFANQGTRCYSYPHPDHVAVAETLWSVDFGVGPQLGATCYVGRQQMMTAVVSQASADAAFELAEDRTRIGAHGRHYGWLHSDVYPLSYAQTTLFHRMQSFWVRFN